jgi:hypothetical protein
MAVAASGSVGDTIAPSANAAAHGSPATSAWATTATAVMVTSTSPTASSVIGRALAHRSRGEEKNAAWYSSGGKNSTKTRSGGSSADGIPGTNPSTKPPRTSRIG